MSDAYELRIRMAKAPRDAQTFVGEIVKQFSDSGVEAEFDDGTAKWRSGPDGGKLLSLSASQASGDGDAFQSGMAEAKRWKEEQLRMRGLPLEPEAPKPAADTVVMWR